VWLHQSHIKRVEIKMVSYIIRDKKGYGNLSKRVRAGEKLLDGKWFNPKHEKEVEHYNAMACAMLLWEIDNDIFEPKFDKWLDEQGNDI
jgi:hypothetical protein